MPDTSPQPATNSQARSNKPFLTAAHAPFGVSVVSRGAATGTTQWFTSAHQRAVWIEQSSNAVAETRMLARHADADEDGTLVSDDTEIVGLHDLADKAREETWQAGLRHAAARHRIVAVALRAVWPTATVIVADLASALAHEGNPHIEQLRSGPGDVLFTQDTCHEAVDRAEEQLSIALDYASDEGAGWLPLTDQHLAACVATPDPMAEYYALELPQ